MRRWEGAKAQETLTFDNGPKADVTQHVIDVPKTGAMCHLDRLVKLVKD